MLSARNYHKSDRSVVSRTAKVFWMAYAKKKMIGSEEFQFDIRDRAQVGLGRKRC
jgi:hypothetical protein